ncbi:hypothetical protein PHAVU_007G163900 [Phaseolus vulgaris]|uniref:DUF7148 domain-containing protein n=1 Tax=Phaseolus vulgaris TaxID=3885 RepID=V7BFB1_PHAVU|nr:hypothetical protein PHAVU_007G163900g [Phaseolus vulgaris]ESW16527.1 hypothetical protein PHAVU_007G163900g [Phaseolus vulgaris]
MMACGSVRQSVWRRMSGFHFHLPLSSASLLSVHHTSYSFPKLHNLTHLAATPSPLLKASARNDGLTDDGVTLGTVKLPSNTDLQRFDSLLFQWANSLCQGANLPLPVPLKVDKIAGGARLGFITIENGKTEVLVYIDCLVSPSNQNSAPMFRAIRNGPLKDKVPPGEPRIMRSLLQALQKSIEIAKL